MRTRKEGYGYGYQICFGGEIATTKNRSKFFVRMEKAEFNNITTASL
jgi:hypothetical protein